MYITASADTKCWNSCMDEWGSSTLPASIQNNNLAFIFLSVETEVGGGVGGGDLEAY